MDDERLDAIGEGTAETTGGLPQPIPPTPPAAVEPEPPRREPTWLLVLGIVLFSMVLAITWITPRFGRGAEQATDPAQARMATGLVIYLSSYLRTADDATRGQLAPQRDQLATTTAGRWQEVSRTGTSPADRGEAALNAAALYGSANDLARARQALETAAERDPERAAAYRELLPLYTDPATAPDLSPETGALVDGASTGALVRARIADVRGDAAGATAVLAAAVPSTFPWLATLGVIATLYGGAVLLGLIAAAVVTARAVKHPDDVTPAPLLATWGPGAALVAIAAYMLVSLPIAVALGLAARALGLQDTATNLAIQAFALVGSAVIVIGSFLVFTGRGFWAWGALGWRYTRGSILTGILGLLAIVPVLVLVAAFTAFFIQPESHGLVGEVLAPGNPWWVGLVMLGLAVVIAPVVEETLFRGILFPALEGRMSGWGAAFLSGALFAAIHGQWFVLPIFTILGAAFAYLFWRTRSLWASTVAHAVFNGASTVIVLMLLWATRGPI